MNTQEIEWALKNYEFVYPSYEDERVDESTPEYAQYIAQRDRGRYSYSYITPLGDRINYYDLPKKTVTVTPEPESGWGRWEEELSYNSTGKSVEVPGVGTVSMAYSETGGEGSAEDIYMIFKIEDEDGNEKFYEQRGAYYSYDGSNWDGNFSEVVPREVKVTRWVNPDWKPVDES